MPGSGFSFIKNTGKNIRKDFKTYKWLYVLFIPVLIYFIVFCYRPMYGLIIAFQDFRPRLGIAGSKWVGFQHFTDFFSSVFFARVLKNTLVLNFLNLVFGFPAPIIFALLLNEVRCAKFKKLVQTATYLPHFITIIIISSIVIQFTNSEGFITLIVNSLSTHKGALISDPAMFRPIYVLSEIWQTFGWNSIVYLAALTTISPELYEAADIDGASKLQKMLRITLPCIMPTVIIMLILTFGRIMSIGWEKTFLLQSPLTYDTSDIISTYVYRKGFEDMSFSYSAAVELFNSVINLVLLTVANWFSKKYSGSSLW